MADYWRQRLVELAAERDRLDKRTDRAVANAMADGLSLLDVAEAAGIPKSTLHRRLAEKRTPI